MLIVSPPTQIHLGGQTKCYGLHSITQLCAKTDRELTLKMHTNKHKHTRTLLPTHTEWLWWSLCIVGWIPSAIHQRNSGQIHDCSRQNNQQHNTHHTGTHTKHTLQSSFLSCAASLKIRREWFITLSGAKLLHCISPSITQQKPQGEMGRRARAKGDRERGRGTMWEEECDGWERSERREDGESEKARWSARRRKR